MKSSDVSMLWILLGSVAIVVVVNWFRLYHAKDYSFLVEAPCDREASQCFYRDCSNADDCPPNGLDRYRTFRIAAADFSKCSDDSCMREIDAGIVPAEEIACDAQVGECGE